MKHFKTIKRFCIWNTGVSYDIQIQNKNTRMDSIFSTNPVRLDLSGLSEYKSVFFKCPLGKIKEN